MRVFIEDIFGCFLVVVLIFGYCLLGIGKIVNVFVSIFICCLILVVGGGVGGGAVGFLGWYVFQVVIGQGLGCFFYFELVRFDVGIKFWRIIVGFQVWSWRGCYVKVWGKSNFGLVFRKDYVLGRDIIFVYFFIVWENRLFIYFCQSIGFWGLGREMERVFFFLLYFNQKLFDFLKIKVIYVYFRKLRKYFFKSQLLIFSLEMSIVDMRFVIVFYVYIYICLLKYESRRLEMKCVFQNLFFIECFWKIGFDGCVGRLNVLCLFYQCYRGIFFFLNGFREVVF